jgi:hypothetical protein
MRWFFFVETCNKVWEVMIKALVELKDKEREIVATGNRKQKCQSNIKIQFSEHSVYWAWWKEGKSDEIIWNWIITAQFYETQTRPSLNL